MKKEVSELEPVHSTTIVERNFNVSSCKLIGDHPSSLMGLMQILSLTKAFLLRFYPESVCNRGLLNEVRSSLDVYLYTLSMLPCATF